MGAIDLKSIDCEKTEDDYIVEILHPSGKTIQVLIPIDGASVLEGDPYGLNMVCNGHYT